MKVLMVKSGHALTLCLNVFDSARNWELQGRTLAFHLLVESAHQTFILTAMYVISLDRLCYPRIFRDSFRLELGVNHVVRVLQKQKQKSNFKRKKHAGASVCNILGVQQQVKETRTP